MHEIKSDLGVSCFLLYHPPHPDTLFENQHSVYKKKIWPSTVEIRLVILDSVSNRLPDITYVSLMLKPQTRDISTPDLQFSYCRLMLVRFSSYCLSKCIGPNF